MKFVKLTNPKGYPCYIVTDQIVEVTTGFDGKTLVYHATAQQAVKETVEEVVCLCKKADSEP